MTVVALLGAVLALHAVFVAATCTLARVVGARIRAVAVGTPALVRFEVSGVKLALGPIPLSASVEFPGRAPDDEDQGPGTWRALPLASRIAVTALPWLVTFALAFALLGWTRGVGSMLHAVPQFLVVLDTTPLVRGFGHVLATSPFPIVVGVVMAKAAAIGALPLPGMPVGALIGEQMRGRVGRCWLAVYVVVVVWTWGRFGWGVVHALVGGVA